MSKTSLLEIHNLKVAIKTQSDYIYPVKNLSFTINIGQTVALLGESGCGKSLTAYSILQQLPNNAYCSKQSNIYFNNIDLLRQSEYEMQKIRKDDIAIIYQEPMTSLNPTLTIKNQCLEILKYKKITYKRKIIKIQNMFQEVGLNNADYLLGNYPHQLSGGMRQRIMIVMALLKEPKLLIADEPTTALDVTIQKQILELLKKIQSKFNMAILLITHDFGVVYEMADKVCVMIDGKLIEQGHTKDIINNPKESYTKNLLKAIPKFTANQDRTKLSSEERDNSIMTLDKIKIYYPIRSGILRKIKSYVKAVDDISFNVPLGKTVAVVGESGSGKSTLAKGLVKLLDLTSGQINLANTKINNYKNNNFRKELQIIFQDPYSSLNPKMIIQDIISEGPRGLGITFSKQDLNILLDLVGLPENSKIKYPHEFSGGQRQRISIARALAVNPKVIICDEITSALDVSIQDKILKLLLDLQKEKNLSYIFITHNISVVANIADQVIVMNQGKMVEFGDVQDVLFNPQAEYTKRLLDSVLTVPVFS
tara:strand:- start:7514 stop:9124 length:1611 start_codon:yes stop_codon:yes gene_type:complete